MPAPVRRIAGDGDRVAGWLGSCITARPPSRRRGPCTCRSRRARSRPCARESSGQAAASGWRCSRDRAQSAPIQGKDVRPLTWAQPVMPGLIRRRPRCRAVYCSTCTGRVGRGPISDISPRSTLSRFGSSSSEVLRKKRADAGDTRIVHVDRQPGADVLGAVDHRAQLQHVERPSVQPSAALAVDRMPGGLEADRDRREGEQGRSEEEHTGGDHDVDRAANHLSASPRPRPMMPLSRVAANPTGRPRARSWSARSSGPAAAGVLAPHRQGPRRRAVLFAVRA